MKALSSWQLKVFLHPQANRTVAIYVFLVQASKAENHPQAARMDSLDNWKSLIEQATKYEAELLARVARPKTVMNEGEAIRVIAK